MQRKVREQHTLAVPRNLVHDVMGMVDPEGLSRRRNVGQKKATKRSYWNVHIIGKFSHLFVAGAQICKIH